MTVSVSTERGNYAAGDSILLTLLVENRTDAVVEVNFTSGQRYDFAILDEAGNTVWRWSDGMGFMQMLGSERYDAGASRVYSERYGGELLPGRYRAVGELTASERLFAGTEFRVDP